MGSKNLGTLFLNKILTEFKDLKCLGYIKNNTVHYLSNEDFFDRVAAISLALRIHGMKDQDSISILSNSCLEWHLFDVAIMMGRGFVTPIYQSYPAKEVEYILKHAESKMIIVENNEQFKKVIEIQDQLSDLHTLISIHSIDEEEIKKLKKGITYIDYKDLLNEGSKELKENRDEFIDRVKSIKGEDIASIIYTSGTTGEPKGAVITQHGFATMLDNTYLFLGNSITQKDVSLTFLPLAHVLGRADSLLHLVFNLQSIYAESIEKVIENIGLVKPTVMIAVPRIFEKIYAKIQNQINEGSFIKKSLFKWALEASTTYFDKIDEDITPTSLEVMKKNLAYKIVFSKVYNRFGGNVRFFVTGGAPLSPVIIKFLRNANLTILEGYGLTETIAPCVLNPAHKQVAGSVGLPIGDVQIKLAEDGEILIKTDAMMREYYKKPDETNEAIKDGWFASGDIGIFDKHGFLKITDRKKDIIITAGGKNVAPQKIENMMKNKKHISHFMVIGDKRKFLTAVVGIEKEVFLEELETLGHSSSASIEEISKNSKVYELIESEIESINKELGSFETIKKFVISSSEFSVENGELTPSLKLKKKVLMNKFKNEIDAMYK